jgi:4-amino-4-deoxy-L-arabinose transferase-like glycosyltransferase
MPSTNPDSAPTPAGRSLAAGADHRSVEPSRAPNEPLSFPERLPADRWIAAGLFVVSCLYLSLFRRYTNMDPDEGIILQGAVRILHGEVLYRDFFSFFTPGSYYFLALIFKVFGNSLIVARTVLVFYGGLFSVFTYWMARRTCARWSALLTVYLLLVTCLPWRFVSLHNWDSTLWCCLTVYCATLWLQARHWGWALGTGSFASLTFLFEQSKGAGLLMGLALGLVIFGWLGRSAIRCTLAQWLFFAAGLAWPLALTLAYFASRHAFASLWADWLWPLRYYSAVNSVSYGYQDWSGVARESMFGSGPLVGRLTALVTVAPCFVVPVLPIISVVLLGHWLLAARQGALEKGRAAYYLLVCSSQAGLLLSIVFVRANATHFIYLSPLFFLVVAWLMDGTNLRSSILCSLRPLLTFFAFMTCTALGLALLVANRNASSTIQTRRGQLQAMAPDAVLEYIDAHVAPGSKIFVYPYLPLFYYLTETFSATRYEYLQPGLHTVKQDRDALGEMAAERTAVVVLEPSFYDRIPASWPNTPLRYLANDPVADYILAHYHSCAVLSAATGRRFFFMMRNDLACPPDDRDASPHAKGRMPHLR